MTDFTDLVHTASKPAGEAVSPDALIPFRLQEAAVRTLSSCWLKNLWFVPNRFKKVFLPLQPQRTYLPYWVFDAFVQTDYQVRARSADHNAAVHNQFTDIVIPASDTLTLRHRLQLGSSLLELVPYSEEYLSTIKSTANSVAMTDAFEQAKLVMQPTIDSTIHDDIASGKRKISRKFSSYSRITAKYVLLPFWISSCTYRGRTYTLAINDCTGDVVGDSPRSRTKTASVAAVTFIALICILYFLAENGLR